MYQFLPLTIVYLGMSFIFLLPVRLQGRYYFYFAVHLIATQIISNFVLGYWYFIPFIVISVSIAYFGARRSFWSALFSFAGYLIAVLIRFLLMILMALCHLFPNRLSADLHLLFFFVLSTVCFSILYLVKKNFILPRLSFFQKCPQKIQLLFLSVFLAYVGLYAALNVYAAAVSTFTEMIFLYFFSLSLFSAIILILVYFLSLSLQEKDTLELQNRELEFLRRYTESLEHFYSEYRVFKHDYKNILSTLFYYADNKETEELKKYLSEKIMPSGELLVSPQAVIARLQFIKIASVKSILYFKIIMALNHKITPLLELSEPLLKVCMPEPDLSRVLGILLDNSIEAASLTPEKELSISIVVTEQSVLFTITNSCPPLSIPVSRLYEKGYTTKQAHEGLGLYILQRIISPLPNVFYTVQYSRSFRQTLEIRKD